MHNFFLKKKKKQKKKEYLREKENKLWLEHFAHKQTIDDKI